jgi:hypothetical protein
LTDPLQNLAVELGLVEQTKDGNKTDWALIPLERMHLPISSQSEFND